jgi:hypothetical protein
VGKAVSHLAHIYMVRARFCRLNDEKRLLLVDFNLAEIHLKRDTPIIGHVKEEHG